MGNGQGIGHAGIDAVTLDYALESKRNGYIPTPNHRKLFAPISGIVTRYPYDHKLVITTTVREGEATVELLHVDPNQGPKTGTYVRAGQPLQAMTFKGKGYGTDFPHLHLGLHNNRIYRDPLPIPGYIENYWTYIDPRDGRYFTQLPEGT